MEVVIDVARRLADPDRDWLERALASAPEPRSVAFRALYASAARRLGPKAQTPVTPPPDVPDARNHWTAADWVRAALLLRALVALSAEAHAAVVLHLFEGSEIGEGVSLLRTLVLLPEPERFLDVALLAVRASAEATFSAMACANAYPARFLSDAALNQMVLKAIFMEVPVRGIEGLAARVTPELTRMVSGYASERRAAGRAVPADVDFVLQGARA